MAKEDHLELILKEISGVRAELKEGLERINGRVRSLENWKAYLIGIFTVIAFGVSIIINAFWG